MNKLVLFMAAASVLAMTGCATTNVSDEKLLDKAESATGVVKSNLSVVPNSKEASGTDLNFKVQDKSQNIYKCYYMKFLWNESDAICTKLNADGSAGNANTANCNDLLKAAGKC